MELSTGAPDDGFSHLRTHKIDKSYPQTHPSLNEDSIDLSKLSFGSDENWLCESESRETNLKTWLYSSDDAPLRSSPKNIDTRTFTRPKKRYVRPSIEKYNEELYGNDLKESDSGQINGEKPLHFDLQQTTSSVYFDNILANAPMSDSFQNMSPPSLVNSMCSSTFANLMESSFIKNDPELREIRDMDFTGTILQHETEPMFQSITESCSSVNSDAPEYFLKKASLTENGDLDVTFTQEEELCDRTSTQEEELCDQMVVLKDKSNALNTTYQRTALDATFQKLDKIDLNSTVTLEKRDDKTIENMKRLLDRRPSPSLDLNRLNYDEKEKVFGNDTSKRNSFGSTDSGENLDFMSLSSSSNGSKRQSVDSINLIVDFQEPKNMGTYRKAFVSRQIMSTPKYRKAAANLWPNQELSPIGDRNSDPEMSSTELPPSVLQNTIRKQKSTGHLNRIMPKAVGQQPKLLEGRNYGLRKPTNLNSMGHTLKGSYTSLRPTNAVLPVAPPPLTAKAPIVAQVPPLPREVPNQDAQFARPQVPRSGLPRPVTGIPRPVSRIPGPKTIRSVSKSAGHQGRF